MACIAPMTMHCFIGIPTFLFNVGPGHRGDHNLRALEAKDVIKVPSRIVAVDGKTGKGSELLSLAQWRGIWDGGETLGMHIL